MAKLKVIQYDPFKKGDTPVFAFQFTPPYEGFDWDTITADIAMTDVSNPVDNVGAAMVRLNQVLTTDVNNIATVSAQLTVAESKALTAETEYKVEIQLKEGGTNVATPITGKVTIVQDYIV